MTASERYDVLKLSNQVCFPLYACSKELISRNSQDLRKRGRTYTQYIVMLVMWEKGHISSRNLASSLHLDYGTLTPVLKRLETAGLLTRARDPEDERLLVISLTKKGRELRDEAVEIPSCIASCMGLDEDEFRTLYVLTYKALANMEEGD